MARNIDNYDLIDWVRTLHEHDMNLGFDGLMSLAELLAIWKERRARNSERAKRAWAKRKQKQADMAVAK